MKLSEYCKFFDFTVEKGKFIDEDDRTEYKYMATDDQQVFHARYGNEPNDFIDQFGSMEYDYIFSREVFDRDDVPQDYKTLIPWLEKNELDNEILHIAKCMIGQENLEDDLEDS